MTPFDVVMIVILVAFGILGLVRGFWLQCVALICWLAAFAIATTLTPMFAELISPYVKNAGLRHVSAFLIIFIIVWFIGLIFKAVTASLLVRAGVDPVKRFWALILGLVQGLLVSFFLIFVVYNTRFNTSNWFNNSAGVSLGSKASDKLQSLAFRKTDNDKASDIVKKNIAAYKAKYQKTSADKNQ